MIRDNRCRDNESQLYILLCNSFRKHNIIIQKKKKKKKKVLACFLNSPHKHVFWVLIKNNSHKCRCVSAVYMYLLHMFLYGITKQIFKCEKKIEKKKTISHFFICF